MNQKSQKQQEALAEQRNKELRAVQALDPSFSCQGIVGEFIGVYIQSEVFAKKIQNYYRVDSKKTGKDEIQLQTLKAALKHFNISIPDAEIASLFCGGGGIRGSKSARQLRNGYLHSLATEDKKEIESNAHKFISQSRKFISIELLIN